MKSADEIFREAFDVPRNARSPEYQRGVMAALKFRLEQVKIPQPFPEGTAAFDAYHAGIDEGHQLWRAEARRADQSSQLGFGDRIGASSMTAATDRSA